MTSAYQTPPMVQGGRPPTASTCQSDGVKLSPEGGVHGASYHDWAGHREARFPRARGGCWRPCAVPQTPYAGEAAWVLGSAGALHCRDGGLRGVTLLGAGDRQVGPCSAADPAGLRQAVREATEE